MDWIDDLAALEALYGTPGEAAQVKITPALTPAYRSFLERSRFCVLTTGGRKAPTAARAATRGRW